MTIPTVATAPALAPEARLMGRVRARTLALVAHLEPADLERVLDPLISPLVWDLAHIAAYEDLWLCHRHGGRALLAPRAGRDVRRVETPRAFRGDLPLLDTAGALRYLEKSASARSTCLPSRGRATARWSSS
jgi:iron(II)-dependent oxidoreductase